MGSVCHTDSILQNDVTDRDLICRSNEVSHLAANSCWPFTQDDGSFRASSSARWRGRGSLQLRWIMRQLLAHYRFPAVNRSGSPRVLLIGATSCTATKMHQTHSECQITDNFGYLYSQFSNTLYIKKVYFSFIGLWRWKILQDVMSEVLFVYMHFWIWVRIIGSHYTYVFICPLY
jgi:hypothetical protein